jgi:hypothetical protein
MSADDEQQGGGGYQSSPAATFHRVEDQAGLGCASLA